MADALSPGDAAALDAWRARRRHYQGEGPPPTERQRAVMADPWFNRRVEFAQRHAGWGWGVHGKEARKA